MPDASPQASPQASFQAFPPSFGALPAPPALDPALSAQLEAQAGYLSTLARNGVELVARLSELNMKLAREALDDALSTGQQMAACGDPLQLSAVAIRGMQPAGEHLRAWQQQMMATLADAQARLAQAPITIAAPPANPARRRN